VIPAPGSLAAQFNLLVDLALYQRAEKLSAMFPAVTPLWEAADRRHDALLKTALLCGFRPGSDHWRLSTEQWAEARAVTIRANLPNHVEQQLRAVGVADEPPAGPGLAILFNDPKAYRS
jgi:hypothetical protein